MSYQKPRSREIEQQLAQLHWRKQQNERSIKNYLEASKVMKQKDTILNLTIDKFIEDAQFLKSIKDDEARRPLVLNDHEVLQIENSEQCLKRRFAKVKFFVFNFFYIFYFYFYYFLVYTTANR